jgi:tetratricopeptide (TPR) repeat protein
MRFALGKSSLLTLVPLAASLFMFHLPWASAKSIDEVSFQKYLDAGDRARDSSELLAAENLYKQAVQQCQKEKGSDKDLAKCLNAQAAGLILAGKSDEAVPIYRRSINLLRKSYGSHSPQLRLTLIALASVLEADGDHANAMTLYNEVLSINETNFGPHDPEVARSLHRLAKAKQLAGDKEAADVDYQKALAVYRKHPQDLQAELATCLKDYEELLRSMKRADEAQVIASESDQLNKSPVVPTPTQSSQSAWQQSMVGRLARSKSSEVEEASDVLARSSQNPVSDRDLAPMFNTLWQVQSTQSRFVQAEPLYKNLAAIDEKTLGPNHPGVALDLTNLGLLYIKQGQFQKAEEPLFRALNILESNYGADNMIVLQARNLLASVYENEGNLSEAESCYKKALASVQAVAGPTSLEMAKTLNKLAYLYYREGKYADAETVYKWALASTQAAVGEKDPLLTACRQDYAQVLRKLNRQSEADKFDKSSENVAPAPALR